MKLTIENFGPISRCDLDLSKQFTVIVGQNNIGKSYAISFLYALIKTLNRFRRSGYGYYNEDLDRISSKIIQQNASEITKELATKTDEVEITKSIIELVKIQLQETIIPSLQQTLSGTFSELQNLQNRLTSEALKITLEDTNFKLELGIENEELALKSIFLGNHHYFAKHIKQNRVTKTSGNRSTIYYPNGDEAQFSLNIRIVASKIIFTLIEATCGQIHDTHYLPASRSGLYQSLSAFGQIVAELAKNRSLLRQKIELPGIAEPLSDYFLKLSDIKASPPDTTDQAYHSIADEIETEILRGQISIEPKTKKILFRPERVELDLDLSATSSMVSEISPIATYIRYVLPKSGAARRYSNNTNRKRIASQLVFLEEPEAHLHPEIQVKLIEILAKLSQTTSTKIILTSHSNYIFNKCSNLIISKALDPAQFSAILFQRTQQGSTTSQLEVSEYGISDENFVEIGEDLYEEKIKLISEINQAKND